MSIKVLNSPLSENLPLSTLAVGEAVRMKDAPAEKAAKDFEAVLLHKIMESMSRTIPESGLFDSGASRQIEGLFWHYLAQEVSDQGGIGLWKELYNKMQTSEALTGASGDLTQK